MDTTELKARLLSLSIREQQVFDLMCELKTTQEIASTLGVGAKTAKFHVSNVYKKLGIKVATPNVTRLYFTREFVDCEPVFRFGGDRLKTP